MAILEIASDVKFFNLEVKLSNKTHFSHFKL